MARKLFLSVVLLSATLPTTAQSRDSSLLIAPDAAILPLDDIGLYTVGYAYRGQQSKSFPPGWSGDFDSQTGIALKPSGEQNGRKAYLMHPPWMGGTGITFQEFCVQLPPVGKVKKILVRGATAMGTNALAAAGESSKSDGVTFRVFANGRKLLDEHRADANWKPFEFDLSKLAGQTLTLRFETDCGPQDNSSFDFALWGTRQLVLQGFVPSAISHPAPPPPQLRRLYPTQSGSAAPPSGFDGVKTLKVQPDGGILSYQGIDGRLQYQWSRPRAATDPPLGKWQLRATHQGAKTAVIVPLAGDARLQGLESAKFKSSRMEKGTNALTCISTYEVEGRTATLRTTAKLSGKSLVLDVKIDGMHPSALDAGSWGPVLRRRAVSVPYYSGQINYLARENLFVNAFLDWTASSSSYHLGNSAIYRARTDGSWVSPRERVVFSAAWHLLETLPNVPNPPSPYRAHLGNKIVLDFWGGRFEEMEHRLQTLHDNGIVHCAVIVHVWQRSGYDNALPAHVPANAGQGGDSAMKALVATGKRLGYDIALHENYVDYYPNYEKFDPEDISANSEGKLENAWYNEGTKIQSFAVAPTSILKLAREQSTQIRDLYAPNADYLDVNSATPPWFHQDYRAKSPGAATFRSNWDATRQLFAFERQNYGGPVLGEGNNHWYWSGYLDGVEAQFGSGWPNNEGQSVPLAVDFDLFKIHPLQFNHGMGYYDRWWKNRTWGAMVPMEVLDQYRMQEVIFGHAGFLNDSTAGNLPTAWLEHHLLSPVTGRYATAKPVRVEYQVNGRWGDSTRAAKLGNWKRALVEYDNGFTVIANDEEAPLKIGNVMLPQHGWIASDRGGQGVVAWTALKQGVIADYCRTPSSTFANARRASDWSQSSIRRVRPAMRELKPTAPREFAVTYEWRVGEILPDGMTCFVHFVDARGDIVAQNDHALPRPSGSWKTGETVTDGPHQVRLPDTLPDGEYGIRIGLLLANGARTSLEGEDDGDSRIRLGTLRVQDGGKTLTYLPNPPTPDRNAIYERRLNTKSQVIDFGDVRTNGSVLVQREKGEWVLRTLPRAGDFTLELSAARFRNPANVRCIEGASQVLKPQVKGEWWSLKLNGAREYRWK